ncbi:MULTISPECIES: GNAT family N-acetyltransferase [Listeria]|uniref:GNAT family N-acetyltransferase n=1 Tax=Listeria TaxID=1637 RepID=UPI0016294EA5|nr:MULTISPECIES: GNAT family N-acetyltransferase [Listeria]MBC1444828.1 GNAT family N-acetyltransferase [Listeria seeligeri]MBC1773740.1 GNAT family N-acetyltransferase [Listeria seeligeri]MBF2384500.1 GNAT family N-acetyltransferase [Listeria seeligeri]MBF2541736.1 GNAT family N-acetyltransferase [Listeria seeligeri]MBF2590229.1 GNAT family N-acetyltransferase [Listeria seeligeri]
MKIREYEKSDIGELFNLMNKEDEEWQFAHEKNRKKYMCAIENSSAYVSEHAGTLIGYIRCKNDDGFGIYILDLLVDKQFRGNGY